MAQIMARATNTVRNKNIAMLVLCVVFLGWFAYDGFSHWPARNDGVVTYMKGMTEDDPPRLDPKYRTELEAWKGWNHETTETRGRMHAIATEAARTGRVDTWKGPLDMAVQRWIVLGLIGAVAAATWWLLRCQKRRAIANESGVSPARGVEIPWDKIELVDNTRWKSAGIVEITYTDAQGNKKKAKFDDYETEREPLIQILDLIAEKAVKAEFIPKEETT